jgi:hypothetical protein
MIFTCLIAKTGNQAKPIDSRQESLTVHMLIACSGRRRSFRKCVFPPRLKQGRQDAALLAQFGMPSQLKTHEVWFSPSIM